MEKEKNKHSQKKTKRKQKTITKTKKHKNTFKKYTRTPGTNTTYLQKKNLQKRMNERIKQ